MNLEQMKIKSAELESLNRKVETISQGPEKDKEIAKFDVIESVLDELELESGLTNSEIMKEYENLTAEIAQKNINGVLAILENKIDNDKIERLKKDMRNNFFNGIIKTVKQFFPKEIIVSIVASSLLLGTAAYSQGLDNETLIGKNSSGNNSSQSMQNKSSVYGDFGVKSKIRKETTLSAEHPFYVERNLNKEFSILDIEKQNFNYRKVLKNIKELQKFVYSSTGKINKAREEYLAQIIFKYGENKVKDTLFASSWGSDSDGNFRQKSGKEIQKALKLYSDSKGKSLKKKMYKLMEHIENDAKILKAFTQKSDKYTLAFTPFTLSPAEMQYLLDNPKEYEAYIELNTEKVFNNKGNEEKFGKDYLDRPLWESSPTKRLVLLKN